MVKNFSGGSKSKKMASKNFKPVSSHRNLRLSEEDCEVYGIITEKLGGGHIRCHGIDGNIYMVHIGGKFRNEKINRYDFILIGLREWQSSSMKNNNVKADLLEVYNEQEKTKLLKINGKNWQVLTQQDNSSIISSSKNGDSDSFSFANETEIEYKELLEKQFIQKQLSSQKSSNHDNNNKENDSGNEEDIIDFDFI